MSPNGEKALEQDNLIENIAPDVLRVLEGKQFFRQLENAVWPAGIDASCHCDNDYRRTLLLLEALGFDEDDKHDILEVFSSRGGFCDCEVMLNVAEYCQFADRYWKKRAGPA